MKSRDDQIRPNEDQFNALKKLHDDIVSGINKVGFIKSYFSSLENHFMKPNQGKRILWWIRFYNIRYSWSSARISNIRSLHNWLLYSKLHSKGFAQSRYIIRYVELSFIRTVEVSPTVSNTMIQLSQHYLHTKQLVKYRELFSIRWKKWNWKAQRSLYSSQENFYFGTFSFL